MTHKPTAQVGAPLAAWRTRGTLGDPSILCRASCMEAESQLIHCLLGGERSALRAEAETTPWATDCKVGTEPVSHTLEHWFSPAPECRTPPQSTPISGLLPGQIIHVRKQLWSELLSKENLRQELLGQLLGRMARITRARAPGTEEVRGHSVHSTEEKPQGHRERMHPGAKGTRKLVWGGGREEVGMDRTQSPRISRDCLSMLRGGTHTVGF